MMDISTERWEELLAYCRVTEDELTDVEQRMVKRFYAAALAYMEQAGISEPAAGTYRRGQYDLIVNAMVLDAYDQRDMHATVALQPSPAFCRIINQLKLTEPVPNLDTGSMEG